MFLFVFLAVLCYLNMVLCIIKIKGYKNCEQIRAKKIGYSTYTTDVKGSELIHNKIRFYVFKVELPINDTSFETLVETTNHKAKKYKNKPYVDLYVTYQGNGRITDAVFKEDKSTIPELLFSFIMGSLFTAIAVFIIAIE